MYIAQDRFARRKITNNVQIMYNTAIGAIFGCQYYAEPLKKICDERDIKVNCNMDLVEIIPDKNEAIFAKLSNGNDQPVTESFNYDFMHVTPKMGPTDIIKNSGLAQGDGFIDVDEKTLQHKKYPNVFALGDCANLPTSKTAAAVSEQLYVLDSNIRLAMKGEQLKQQYDGYTSCPLVTGVNKLILAEFGYGGVPMETFPFDQRKERLSMFIMKKDLMPLLYWEGLLKGYWKGPKNLRRIMHFGMV
eukprot:TRINITY_DN5889_c0_g2_i1.p2 TRINITY_DN5889_c0_g2~~TRINITY_DN5889_c0_g2_i1.p2  ORF type:complete len:289 (+),score=24.91 TRINITY_DN5889_c0_g2_i1:130-867(+)